MNDYITTNEKGGIRINVRFQSVVNSALPVAHTCFYQLDLPNYNSKDVLLNKLLYAIENSNTFDLA